jgi:hypothetical protein
MVNPNPIDLVIIDGVRVSKAGERGFEKARHRLRMFDANEVRATDLSAQSGGIEIDGAIYLLDTSDSTTEDDGFVCIIDAKGNRFINENQFSHLLYGFDGNGATLSSSGTPDKYMDIHGDCRIVRWRLFGDASLGSCQVDLWKTDFDTYVASGVSAANSITASAKPELISARAGESSTLTGWTVDLDNGDVMGAVLSSVTSFTKLTLSLRLRHKIR